MTQDELKNPDVRELLRANGYNVFTCGYCRKLTLEGGLGFHWGRFGEVCRACWERLWG